MHGLICNSSLFFMLEPLFLPFFVFYRRRSSLAKVESVPSSSSWISTWWSPRQSRILSASSSSSSKLVELVLLWWPILVVCLLGMLYLDWIREMDPLVVVFPVYRWMLLLLRLRGRDTTDITICLWWFPTTPTTCRPIVRTTLLVFCFPMVYSFLQPRFPTLFRAFSFLTSFTTSGSCCYGRDDRTPTTTTWY